LLRWLNPNSGVLSARDDDLAADRDHKIDRALAIARRQHGVDRCRPVGSDLSQEGGDCSGCLAPRVNLAAVSGTDPNLTARPDVKNNTARGARPVPQVRASATPAAA
jgi:hypothetical protein